MCVCVWRVDFVEWGGNSGGFSMGSMGFGSSMSCVERCLLGASSLSTLHCVLKDEFPRGRPGQAR